MERHRLSHLKRNLIVLFALCLTLAGTAYASVTVAQRSTAGGVTCGGRCPAARVYWTYVGPGYVGGLAGSGYQVTQTALGGVPAQLYQVGSGNFLVTFTNQDVSNCAKFANVTSGAGYAVVGQFSSTNTDPTQIPVQTYSPAGVLTDLPFDVGVLCGGGLGATTETGH